MKGFTLIEIMIVICIVGLLAAILIPATQTAIHGATEKTIEECKKIVAEQCSGSVREEMLQSLEIEKNSINSLGD